MAQEKAEDIMSMEEPKLIEILASSGSTVFAKAKACQRLAIIGTRESVVPLAGLLSDPKHAHYARFALEPIPDSSVDEALRRALQKLSGRLLVGVIHSIGNRKDALAVEILAKLMDDSDGEVATAAAGALGRISGVEAAKELRRVLDRTKTVAGACLECAEGLLAAGNKEPALGLYEALLLRSDIPAAARAAALSGKEKARS